MATLINVILLKINQRYRNMRIIGTSATELIGDAIITNPPYSIATEFVERALALRPAFCAFLLRVDWDSAGGRRKLFDDPRWATKLILRKRIVWIEPAVASPSFNHAWFIWREHHSGPATLAYAA